MAMVLSTKLCFFARIVHYRDTSVSSDGFCTIDEATKLVHVTISQHSIVHSPVTTHWERQWMLVQHIMIRIGFKHLTHARTDDTTHCLHYVYKLLCVRCSWEQHTRPHCYQFDNYTCYTIKNISSCQIAMETFAINPFITHLFYIVHTVPEISYQDYIV